MKTTKKIKEFYVYRVVINSLITRKEDIMRALTHPIEHRTAKSIWTFDDSRYHKPNQDFQAYISGSLIRYKEDGSYTKHEKDTQGVVDEYIANPVTAALRYYYFPADELFIVEKISSVKHTTIEKQFHEIIENTLSREGKGDSELRSIGDLETFRQKVITISSIHSIDVKVSPSNPIFDQYWKELDDYVSGRNLSDMTIREKAKDKKAGILSRIVDFFKRKTEQLPENTSPVADEKLTLTDSAILMALSGYGTAKITGNNKRKQLVTVKSADKILIFGVSTKATEDQAIKSIQSQIKKLLEERNWRYK